MQNQNLARREDWRLLTGNGHFVADGTSENTLFAGFFRSDIGHSKVTELDVARARKLDGVVEIFTSDDLQRDGVGPIVHVDLPRDDGGPSGSYPQPLLNENVIRHVGEPIALVVAKHPFVLLDALEAIEFSATDAGPLEGIAFCRRLGDRDEVARRIDASPQRTAIDINIPRVSATPLEPRGGIARPLPDGGLHFLAGTQNPFALRDQIAAHFGWDPERVHIEAGDVGGSFGLKGFMTREDALLCWAAQKLGVEIAWLPNRSESFLSDAQGRGVSGRIVLGIDHDLKILALSVALETDVGAYPGRRAFGLINNANGLTGMYDIPAVAVEIAGMLSPRAPLAPFRGNGRPEISYAIERTLDHAARAIGCDPVVLRQRNLIPPEAMPVTSALGTRIDCGDFPAVMGTALDLASGAEDRRAEAAARGRIFGFGLANCVESAGKPGSGKPRPDHARLTIHQDGRIVVAPGVMSVGQGHETGLSRMVAERLQVDPGRIEYRHGDTDAVSNGRGSGGSAGLTIGGSAVWTAIGKLLDEGYTTAARQMGCTVEQLDYRDGAFFRSGSNESLPLAELAAAAGGPWVVEASFLPEAATYPNGTHICEVEIDPETGQVAVTRYVAAEDVGRILNAVLVDGQLHGGIAQGLSTGLGEHMVFDESGQILTGSLMDYRLLRAADVPMFRLATVEVPTELNPLGVKGVGEAGTVGATAAFASAVCDALARAGVADFQPPATPARVWQALQSVVPTAAG
ncbi:MAG TPA: xanthine dehydrogenase family protein molybdopterin-binding subunit [Afifellaceae bacterium]|nr:xanthine dehydrogenase family protein molybdopterin-binding subunit [Afifellaceae bacterium]